MQLQGRLARGHAEQRVSELIITKDAVVVLVGVAYIGSHTSAETPPCPALPFANLKHRAYLDESAPNV